MYFSGLRQRGLYSIDYALNEVPTVSDLTYRENEDEHIGIEVMTKKQPTAHGSNRFDIYEIVLQGHLSSQWSSWFDGFTITLDQHGWTILVGPVVDQAALHGMLKKIRDLGITLISVNRLDPGKKAAKY